MQANDLIRRLPKRWKSPYDAKDFPLEEHMRRGVTLRTSREWGYPRAKPFDQGETQHCGGFGFLNWKVGSPINSGGTNKTGHDLYYFIKDRVEHAPLNEDGVYTRSVGKAALLLGLADKYAFAGSLLTARQFLLTQGGLLAGTIWTYGMMTPDSRGVIHATGPVLSGHLWWLRGFRDGMWIGEQTWGAWGINGKFYVPDADMQLIFRQGAELLAMLQVRK